MKSNQKSYGQNYQMSTRDVGFSSPTSVHAVCLEERLREKREKKSRSNEIIHRCSEKKMNPEVCTKASKEPAFQIGLRKKA